MPRKTGVRYFELFHVQQMIRVLNFQMVLNDARAIGVKSFVWHVYLRTPNMRTLAENIEPTQTGLSSGILNSNRVNLFATFICAIVLQMQ